MASEAITRNDLKAILNEVLPPTPSEYRKLLWTNPDTSYSTGTISLDLSEYDEIEILFYTDDSFTMSFYSRAKIGKSGTASWWDVRTDLSNLNNINSVTRQYSVSTSGVTFQNGNMIYNGASYSAWSGRCIPYQIYGIKYERVQPPVLDAEVEPLATGATLYRIGRTRMLVFSDFVYGTTLSALASADRPSSTATGMGLRYNSSAYFCFAFIAVNTNGNINISNVGNYNTSSGISTPGTGDKFNATVVWYV